MKKALLGLFPILCMADANWNELPPSYTPLSLHSFQTKTSSGLFATIEGFYWKSTEEGLPYAIKVNSTITDNSEAFLGTNNRSNNPNFNWDPGFRVGLGYHLPFDHWDIVSRYTQFSNKATGKAQSDFPQFNSFLLPLIEILTGNNDFPFYVHTAKANLKVQFNQVDLEAERPFLVSRTFFLKPHAGLRSAWIYQNYDVKYGTFYALPSKNFPTVSGQKITLKNNFWGIGILGGLDTGFQILRHWNLFSNIDCALLYGAFHCSEHSVYSPDILKLPAMTAIPNSRYRSSFAQIQGIVDFQLGTSVTVPFRGNPEFFTLQLGWEQHLFFGQNNFLLESSDWGFGVFKQNSGDLAFSGWTFSLKIEM